MNKYTAKLENTRVFSSDCSFGRKYASFEGFCYLLDRQQFTHYGNLKTNLRVCKRAHFGLRYRLFQAPIWCISCPDMVHFANRKSPFRKTTVFLRRFDEERTGAEKAFSRITTG